METVGEMLVGLRSAAGLTSAEVADRSGLSRQTISKAERGGALRLSSLIRIIEAIGPGSPTSTQRQFHDALAVRLRPERRPPAGTSADRGMAEPPAEFLLAASEMTDPVLARALFALDLSEERLRSLSDAQIDQLAEHGHRFLGQLLLERRKRSSGDR